MLRQSIFNPIVIQCRQYAKNVMLKTKTQPRSERGEKLITCKRPEFDLYTNDTIAANAKLDEIPLASAGWQHYKSKHDYFIIHPHLDKEVEAEPTQSFDKFELHPDLVRNLNSRLDIHRTTSIQQNAIPVILSGDHTLIAAETGCGKTIAYLLPLIQSVLQRKQNQQNSTENTQFNSPQVLILTPGRELALQIAEVAENLCHGLGIKIAVQTGGGTKQKMLHASVEEVDILIGSIGVISKMMTHRIYRRDEVRHIVLDESDTLLDESFILKLSTFLKYYPVLKKKEHIQ